MNISLIASAIVNLDSTTICMFYVINNSGECARFKLSLSIVNDAEKIENANLFELIFNPKIYITGSHLNIGKFLNTDVNVYADLKSYSRLNATDSNFEDDFNVDNFIDALYDYFGTNKAVQR